MKTIYKYELGIVDEQSISMPAAFKPLSVQIQKGKLCMWSAVDLDVNYAMITVRIVGTGHPFPDFNDCQYIGTAQDGQFVWHVFVKR